jgi:hypothetical protein
MERMKNGTEWHNLQSSIFNLQPKIIDRADAVKEDGKIERMKDGKIRKRFALHSSILNFQCSTEGHRPSRCCQRSWCI